MARRLDAEALAGPPGAGTLEHVFNVGPLELIIVLIIALIVLGPKKLPEVGRSVGKGMREFKAAIGGGRSDRDDDPLAGIDWNEHGEFPDFDEELELERDDASEPGDDASERAPHDKDETRSGDAGRNEGGPGDTGESEARRRDRERDEFGRVQAEEEARARQGFS